MPTRKEFLDAILESRKGEANLRELTAAWLIQFGGVEGLAKEAKLQFDNAKSETEKTKILIAGIDLVKQVAGMNKNGEDPINSMSDEDLRGAVETVFHDSSQ